MVLLKLKVRHVVQAARNGLLTAVYDAVDAARSEKVWGQLKRAPITTERRQHYQASHAIIALAVTDRDAAAAEDEIRKHLVEVKSNMLAE